MNIATLTSELRKEFQRKLDEALIHELQQLELEEEHKQSLAEELPNLVLPSLTVDEENRAKDLIKKLDKQVGQLAELGANIGKVSSDYYNNVMELKRILANKEHSITTRYTANMIDYMLSTLARIIKQDTVNGVFGFNCLPDKAFIENKLRNYRGI